MDLSKQSCTTTTFCPSAFFSQPLNESLQLYGEKLMLSGWSLFSYHISGISMLLTLVTYNHEE